MGMGEPEGWGAAGEKMNLVQHMWAGSLHN